MHARTPCYTQCVGENRAHYCSVPCNNQNFPWVPTTLKLHTNDKELDCPPAAHRSSERASAPKVPPEISRSKRRIKSSKSKEKDSAPDLKHSLWTRHKTPRDKVTPWSQNSWSYPWSWRLDHLCLDIPFSLIYSFCMLAHLVLENKKNPQTTKTQKQFLLKFCSWFLCK